MPCTATLVPQKAKNVRSRVILVRAQAQQRLQHGRVQAGTVLRGDAHIDERARRLSDSE